MGENDSKVDSVFQAYMGLVSTRKSRWIVRLIDVFISESRTRHKDVGHRWGVKRRLFPNVEAALETLGVIMRGRRVFVNLAL